MEAEVKELTIDRDKVLAFLTGAIDDKRLKKHDLP
jgi:hypothetical protein